jgi:hypothetical protein
MFKKEREGDMLSFGTTLYEKVVSKHPKHPKHVEEEGRRRWGELEAEMEHVLNTGHGVETVGKESTEQDSGKHLAEH